MKKLPSIHPGEILMEELLKPYDISQNQLAKAIGVAPRRINEIVLGKRAVTADTALRLAQYFKMSAEFWLGLQKDYELEIMRDEFEKRQELKKIKSFKAPKVNRDEKGEGALTRRAS